MKPTELMKKYMDLGLFTYKFNLLGLHYYEVGDSFNFPMGKKERVKFVNHLNHLGFRHHHSYYTHSIFF